jgi:hypothetical protein
MKHEAGYYPTGGKFTKDARHKMIARRMAGLLRREEKKGKSDALPYPILG